LEDLVLYGESFFEVTVTEESMGVYSRTVGAVGRTLILTIKKKGYLRKKKVHPGEGNVKADSE